MIEFGSEPLRWEMASWFLFIMSVDIPKLKEFFQLSVKNEDVLSQKRVQILSETLSE